MKQWIARAEDAGLRLATFIKQNIGAGLSGREIKRAIESNQCTVNGTVENFASVKLKKGDRVRFDLSEPAVDKKLEIIYEDEHLICYNKPIGMLSEELSETLVHRLDKDTTGLILIGKTELAVEELIRQFRERHVHKTYLALVDGVVRENKGVIENRIARISTEGKIQWGVSDDGALAVTEWEVVQKGPLATLVECRPITGRTHQIRVHLMTLGHPVLGDYQYCRKFRSSYPATRPLLHASELRFTHPVHQTPIYLMAPLPDDFTEAMREIFP